MKNICPVNSRIHTQKNYIFLNFLWFLHRYIDLTKFKSLSFNEALSNPVRYCFSISSCYSRKIGGAYICVYFTFTIINAGITFIGIIKSF